MRIDYRDLGERIKTLKGHTGSINDVCFTHDGTKVVSTSDDQTVKVWNIETEELLVDFKEHTRSMRCCQVTPDDKMVISTGYDGALKIWDINTGEIIYNIEHDNGIMVIDISPDGTKVLCGLLRGDIYVYNIQSGELLLHLPTSHFEIYDVCILPDNLHGMYSGQNRGEINIFNLETGEIVSAFTDHADNSGQYGAGDVHFDITDDGKTAVSCDGGRVDSAYAVYVWDVEKRKTLLEFDTHRNGALQVLIAPDNTTAISIARAQYQTAIWDIHTGEVKYMITNTPMKHMDISSDGKYLVFDHNNDIAMLSLGDLIHIPKQTMFIYQHDNQYYSSSINSAKLLGEVDDIILDRDLFIQHGTDNVKTMLGNIDTNISLEYQQAEQDYQIHTLEVWGFDNIDSLTIGRHLKK